MKWSEKLAVRYSDSIVSDNQEIANYVRTEYSVSSHIIAYGGDHAVAKVRSSIDKNELVDDYALALCRIEPENNIHVILEAFAGTERKLKFIGNWTNSQYGVNLKNKYSKYSNIELIDPVYDLDILDEIRSSCSLYIHGHSAGGTNPSLVEMMFFAKPIICFDCKYNRYTTHNQSDYFTSSTDLREKIHITYDLNQGDILEEIARQNYTWIKIRAQYEKLVSNN